MQWDGLLGDSGPQTRFKTLPFGLFPHGFNKSGWLGLLHDVELGSRPAQALGILSSGPKPKSHGTHK